MAPYRNSHTAARLENTVDLTQRCRCRAPNPPEAGRDVEALVGPRQRVHIADPDVRVRAPVLRDRYEPGRRVDARTVGAAKASKFDCQTRTARDIDEPLSVANAESVMQSDVLTTVGRLAQGGKVDRCTAPALVHQLPVGADADCPFRHGAPRLRGSRHSSWASAASWSLLSEHTWLGRRNADRHGLGAR